MAEHQLAHRHERKAQSSLCRHPCAHRRRTTTANQGQGPATSARGGSLAHRRTQGVGREEILSRQPAGKDRPAHLGGYHQGAMDLRTGSPTAEGRTRSRSLRGTILARPSPPCAHDDDRVRLPPASPPCNCKAGKKESTGHRPSRPCQPCATPSSNSSLDHRRSDARIAENGFATSSGGSKSAKVVLGPGTKHRLWSSASRLGRAEIVAQSLERGRAQQTIVGEPAVFDFRLDDRLHPCRLRLLHRHGERRTLDDERIQALACPYAYQGSPMRSNCAIRSETAGHSMRLGRTDCRAKAHHATCYPWRAKSAPSGSEISCLAALIGFG